VSQTEEAKIKTEEAKITLEHTTEQVERVRKVFVGDLSLQQKVHTVFRVAKKSRHLARSGKPFLALSLVDKTGAIPGRIFDNVETADAAFQENDYLLLRGTVINFRGKPQLVVEQLECLAPEPIDAHEFMPPSTPPNVEEKQNAIPKIAPPKTPKKNRPPPPSIAQALENLCLSLEAFIQEKIEQQLAGLSSAIPSIIPSAIPAPHKPPPPAPKTEPKAEPKPETPHARGLPKEFVFKPFDVLTAEEDSPAPPSPAEPPPSEMPPPPPNPEDKPS